MSKKYERVGEGDIRVQIILRVLEVSISEQIASIVNNGGYRVDEAVAMIAVSVGEVMGKIQGEYEQHAKECENCAKGKDDYRELFFKNFTNTFSDARNGIAENYKEIEADAAHMVSKFFNHGSKSK